MRHAEQPARHRPRDILRYTLERDPVSTLTSLYQEDFLSPQSTTRPQVINAKLPPNGAAAVQRGMTPQQQLLEADRAAVESCTEKYKRKLVKTPPFSVDAVVQLRPVTSTYRSSFEGANRKEVLGVPTAGKLLPRDDVTGTGGGLLADGACASGAPTSLNRTDFVQHNQLAYLQRQDDIKHRIEETEHRREDTMTEFKNNRFTATSLAQDSFVPPTPGARENVKQSNPDRVKAEAATRLRDAHRKEYYRMQFTSTQRGDYAAPKGDAKHAPVDFATIERTLTPLLDDPSHTAAATINDAPKLSAALSAMSVMLADGPATRRCQSSCEIIPQRKPFPHAGIHVPSAAYSGSIALERRLASQAPTQRAAGKSLGTPGGNALRHSSSIFFENCKDPIRSVSQMSYTPVAFDTEK